MSKSLAEAMAATIDPEAIAADTLAFVEVVSETGKEGEGSLFLEQLLRREGFEVERDDFLRSKRPNVYARIKGHDGGGSPCLVFNGHTDTIPIGDCQSPSREDDWIRGRGTEDMKGGLVAMVHAASALRRCHVDLCGDLWLTGVIGHETPVGKKEGPRRLIDLMRAGKIPAEGVIIVEGPCAVWAASLGSALFNLRVYADREPIHTIKVPFLDNPVRCIGGILQGLERLEKKFLQGETHPLCGRHQLNVGMVRAGDWFNRLPVEMEVTGTRRWTPGTTRADVERELQGLCVELADHFGLRFEVELSNDREPFETPEDHPLVRGLVAAAKADGADPEIIGMGLVGDANLYANDGGVPTVYYGPAHETAHSNLEQVSASQLAHCSRVYALAAAEFCGRH
ncbi:MAG: M20/M25/M40 family metallo-hydrolase [Candidatus Latescibacterota bacterium]|nr:M20/M25/M40 family metallo-hydrolase [Candidatus Latescibacterota bacterium]